jgi:repressor LexA
MPTDRPNDRRNDSERRRPGRPKVTELPDPVTGLTRRQQAILDVIRDSVERRGYPPSIREICESAGLASTSSVAHQLSMLERKGYLRRDPNRPRAVDVRTGSTKPYDPSQPVPKAARRALAVSDDAMIDGEATVKTLQRKDGQAWLLPHNPAYAPIDGNDARILGRVVTVLRKL